MIHMISFMKFEFGYRKKIFKQKKKDFLQAKNGISYNFRYFYRNERWHFQNMLFSGGN